MNHHPTFVTAALLFAGLFGVTACTAGPPADPPFHF